MPNGNVMALTGIMHWIINHRAKVEEIGKNARKTYEKYFTLEILGKNLEAILDETEQRWKDRYSVLK